MKSLLSVDTWQQVLTDSFRELGTNLAGLVPKLVAAAVILAIGWAISKFVEKLFAGAFHRFGLDRAAERMRVTDALRQAGIRKRASGLLAGLLFWILMLTFVLSAVETLGLTAAAATIHRLITYLPNVLAAALIFLLGLLAGRLVENLVGSGAAVASIPQARGLGVAAKVLVVLVVIVLALEQLGVETRFLITVASVLVATLGFSMGLAFALGARNVITHILAGHFLRQTLSGGQTVEVQGRRGIVQRVGPVDTLVEEGGQAWTIPNAALLEETVSR